MIYNIVTQPIPIATVAMAIELISFTLMTIAINYVLLTRRSDWKDGVRLLNDIFAIHESFGNEYRLKFPREQDKMVAFIKKAVLFGVLTVAVYPPGLVLLFEMMPDLFRYLKTDRLDLNLGMGFLAAGSLYVDWVFLIILTIVGEIGRAHV